MIYSQMKVFIPDGVEVSIDGLCSLLGFTNLNRDIRVTGARFVFSLQALSTHHCLGETHGSTQKDKGNWRIPPSRENIHQWCWSSLTTWRFHRARSAWFVSCVCHALLCQGQTLLVFAQRFLVCSSLWSSCDPLTPWWCSGFGPLPRAWSSSLLPLEAEVISKKNISITP